MESPVSLPLLKDVRSIAPGGQACTRHDRELYDKYVNLCNAPKEALEAIIDMYLSTGTTMPKRVLRDVHKYLMQGILVNNLKVYDYLPYRYKYIVKLLYPEYDVKITKDSFAMFTINKVIYDIASEQYLIEDKYRNATSIWFMKRLKNKGIRPNRDDICYYLKNDLWECARYAFSKYRFVINESIVKNSVKSGIMDSVVYLLNRNVPRSRIANYAVMYGQCRILSILGPDIKIKPGFIRVAMKNKYHAVMLYVIHNHRFNRALTLFLSIRTRWLDGILLLLPCTAIDINMVIAAIHSNRVDILTLVYKEALKYDVHIMPLLLRALANKLNKMFVTMHKICPIPLCEIPVRICTSPGVVRYCAEYGMIITEDDIVEAVRWKNMHIIKALLDISNIRTVRVLREAIRIHKLELVKYLRRIGCEWDVSCTNIAFDQNIYDWLVSSGCPVE